jgi:predicted amidohydrolase
VLSERVTVAGTFPEIGAEGRRYQTAALLEPSGAVLGFYRKRRPTNPNKWAAGQEVGVWETRLGRVALLICFDVENEDVLRETLARSPHIILNPINIPAPAHFSSAAGLVWRNGMDTVARKFEGSPLFAPAAAVPPPCPTDDGVGLRRCTAECRERGVTLVRADQPRESGALGSSLVVDPAHTFYAPSMHACSFSVYSASLRPAGRRPPSVFLTRAEAAGAPANTSAGAAAGTRAYRACR